MQQLSGMDSAFLAAESSRTPMHVTAVLVYEPSSRSGEALLEMIRARFLDNLEGAAVFRQKLLRAPMRYDHPYWADDDAFDLDNHVHHTVLPRPGDWQQFRSTVTQLHVRPLNLERPLWEAHVVEGLGDMDGVPAGGFAVCLKLHHAAIDGVTATKIVAALHSMSSTDDEPGSGSTHWQPGPRPSRMALTWNSYRNYWRRQTDFWRTVGQVVPAIRNARSRSGEQPKFAQKFRTRFNTGVSQRRVFDSIDMELDQLKRCRRLVAGSTINDVVVSIVGGGLRRYLLGRDELTEDSLVAGAPINIRETNDAGSPGNLISMMRIPLGTNIADPVQRLQAVHQGSMASKAYAKTVGLDTISNIAQNVNPQLLVLGVRAATSEMLNDLVSAPVHTMVSNVPGPPVDMYLSDARLRRVIGLGPLVDQVGLFHAVTSAGNSMSVSFVCCPKMMPDAERYSECLRDSYEEIRNAD